MAPTWLRKSLLGPYVEPDQLLALHCRICRQERAWADTGWALAGAPPLSGTELKPVWAAGAFWRGFGSTSWNCSIS